MGTSGAGEILEGDCDVGRARVDWAVVLTADNRGNRILRVGVEVAPDWVIVTEGFGVEGGAGFNAEPCTGIGEGGGYVEATCDDTGVGVTGGFGADGAGAI